MEMSGDWKPIRASRASLRVTNPIRDIVDQLKPPNIPGKPLISLSIGDPTVFGNLNNPDSLNDKLIENIKSRKYNGYAHSAGYEAARNAIARKFSLPNSPLTSNDVIIASGASGALDIAISGLANEGQNILLPAPGFSIYQTICEYKGIQQRHYRCLPEKNWEIDLVQLESLIDGNTAAILINNPSNPTGSVFSREHLLEILRVAERHHLPIISDEIYGGMVFEGNTFYPLASLSENVPVLSIGGLAKVFLVPGWRLGWILVQDRHNLLQEVRVGLVKLSQLILGANTLIQSVVDEALFQTQDAFHKQLNMTLQKQAFYLAERLEKVGGLQVIKPGGAMYMMFGIKMEEFPAFSSDIEFCKKLLEEEAVLVLPGKIFKMDNFVRLVICPPQDKLEEACNRIEMFCRRHHR